MGLTESVRHRWKIDGVTVRTTSAHRVNGGRKEGFRLWTALPIDNAPGGARISVDVETDSGQLIGSATIRVSQIELENTRNRKLEKCAWVHPEGGFPSSRLSDFFSEAIS